MTKLCGPFDPAGPYVRGVLSYVDCQATNLAEQGYRAIGAGTQFAQALDGLLIVAVAVFGYRMLLGEAPALRDGVLLVFKIGLVLALAQHWSAYQSVVFNLATRAPAGLVSDMFGQGGGSAGPLEAGLIDRVEAVDMAIAAVLHPERATTPILQAQVRPPVAGAADPNAAGPELAPDVRETLTSTDNTLLLTVLAGNVGVRIALAVLLAMAPLFFASLLFGTARALFAGWIRAMLGAMIAALALPVVTAFELALLEPQVAALLRAFRGGSALGAMPERLWVTASVFALATVLLLLLVARAAATIRFPHLVQLFSERVDASGLQAVRAGMPQPERPTILTIRDHAQHVADAAKAAERRDEANAAPSRTTIIERGRGKRQSHEWQGIALATGARTAARIASGRKSAAAQRRDGN